MTTEIEKLAVFRIVHMENLGDILQNGLYCKNNCPENMSFKTIGNKEIIEQRGATKVKCYPKTVVNDFVPFYFSIRTPMLYNIFTKRNVINYPQEDIIYLCFKLTDLANDGYQWCYTDGNAATVITKFYTSLEYLDKIDWHSVRTTDFRLTNSDNDNDRVRKKHSEFLVKGFVPSKLIRRIVVFNAKKKAEVEAILNDNSVNINVLISPVNKYYFQ